MSALVLPLLLLPLLLRAGAAATAGLGPRDAAWRRAEWAAALSTAGGAGLLAATAWSGPQAAWGLRADLPGAVVMLLVGFVGWVVLRFSARYLAGERDERRFLALLAATLAAVGGVLVADHLALLALAWVATSLTLHRLLRFYPERAAARLAAHKKAIAARGADLSLLGALALLGTAYGTLSLSEMLARAATLGLPPLAQAGMVLLVLTVLLKCAQMPMHGWLIQVMEAPTPVSALLHAGVVNLGGLVLIRFSPMLAEAPWAQGLLAVAATVTVLGATLVMGTRISIKVMLAWSTVAQMGFMLLQLALGLPAMALLHLVAHSLYKAHAFLAAGGVVQRRQALRLAPAAAAPSAARWALAAGAGLVLVVGGGVATGTLAAPAALLAGSVLAATLAPLLAAGRAGPALGVAAGWLAGHALASSLVTPVPAAPLVLVVAVGVALAGLFLLQAAIVLCPQAAWVQRLHPLAYGGFHLDERVSRWLLARFPVPAAPGSTGVPTPPQAAAGGHPA